jgi:hypothetical protein
MNAEPNTSLFYSGRTSTPAKDLGQKKNRQYKILTEQLNDGSWYEP